PLEAVHQARAMAFAVGAEQLAPVGGFLLHALAALLRLRALFRSVRQLLIAHQASSSRSAMIRPRCRVIIRWRMRAISARSWLAISTVVPRRLMSSNTPMISEARRGSRLPVGSSASS